MVFSNCVGRCATGFKRLVNSLRTTNNNAQFRNKKLNLLKHYATITCEDHRRVPFSRKNLALKCCSNAVLLSVDSIYGSNCCSSIIANDWTAMHDTHRETVNRNTSRSQPECQWIGVARQSAECRQQSWYYWPIGSSAAANNSLRCICYVYQTKVFRIKRIILFFSIYNTR